MPRSEVFNRDEVLEKAKNVFWLKGYNATSMQDLVNATGLNRSSIYNSFESKLNLYKLTLEKYQNEGVGFFEVITHSNLNGFDSVKKIFETTLNLMIKDANRKGCMFVNCNTEMGNQNMLLKNLTKKNQHILIGFFESLIKKGQIDGSISKEREVASSAIFLASSFQGFRITGMNISDAKSLQSIIKNTLTILK